MVMPAPSRLLLLLTAVLAMPSSVFSASVQYCSLEESEMQPMALNPATGEYFLTDSTLTEDGERRDLLLTDSLDFLTAIQPRQLLQDDSNATDSWVRFQARKCSCGNHEMDYFCPLPWTHCSVKGEGNPDRPGCVLIDRKTRVIFAAWLVCLCCYLGLFLYLMCTNSGRSIIDYIMVRFRPNWNQWVADRIQQKDPERATFLITRYARQRRRLMEQRFLEIMSTRTEAGIRAGRVPDTHVLGLGGVLPRLPDRDEHDEENPQPTQLALTTRVYRRADPRNGDKADEAEEELTCSICFMEIDEGERIGVLPCGHKFHASCLKAWLPKRNVCPLCAKPAATPRYDNIRKKEQHVHTASSSYRVVDTASSSSGSDTDA